MARLLDACLFGAAVLRNSRIQYVEAYRRVGGLCHGILDAIGIVRPVGRAEMVRRIGDTDLNLSRGLSADSVTYTSRSWAPQ